jgi:predicted tellurium resistance membrane protein TerC
MDGALALLMLTGMEVLLGIDNIIFVSIVVGSLPREQQSIARTLGLSLALVARMGLLLGIRGVMAMDQPLLHLEQLGVLPAAWLRDNEVNAVTPKDLVLIAGGLFLVAKSVLEIHDKLSEDLSAPDDALPPGNPEERTEQRPRRGRTSLPLAIVQVILLDLVFSLDSIISAIGMVNEVWIMLTAMTIAVAFMGIFSLKISRFIENHPSLRMLALAFLALIGVVLIADGMGTPISRGSVFLAMAFAVAVEALNMRGARRRERAQARRRWRELGTNADARARTWKRPA